MTERRMIFAAPRPIGEGSSGSMMRMRALRAAFRALGYQVDEVAGPLEARMAAMARVMRQMAEGVRYDFAYMENHTIPLHLTEPRLRLARRYPLADLRFLRACRRHGVPVGVFYRDVWWRFPEYRRSSPVKQRLLRTPFHWLELLLYARFADLLYVPHLAMADALPLRPRRVKALPPGISTAAPPAPMPPLERELRLFYVGGVGPFYRLHRLVEAVRRVEGVTLTICCRPHEWQLCRDSYADLITDRVKVVHAHGDQLVPYFRSAHVLSCFVAPTPYWRVTVPIKLFEYLGHGRPILAACGTNAGAFVDEHEIGWTAADDAGELAALLQHLRSAPDELALRAANTARLVPEHTWQVRARQVAEDLSAPPPAPATVSRDARGPLFEQDHV